MEVLSAVIPPVSVVSFSERMSLRAHAYPSTSPSFFPLAANSLSSSTPTNRPVFPLTLPTNRTVPYISPGTLTASPTSNPAPTPEGVAGMLPVNASSDALRLISAAEERREGDEADALRIPERCRAADEVAERSCCLGVVRLW